jgi:UDP:flavonoid glycosyltransferase YjiC (YdhE family)
MAAIDAGVPQLLALDPLDRGNETTGPAVRKRGVGIVTTYDRVEAETLNRLLTDAALRTATAEVQAEIAELPTPAELVPRLLELR